MSKEYNNNTACYKCGGEVTFEKVEISCKCGAVEHYKKTCKKCGFISYIHRHVIYDEQPQPTTVAG